MNQAKFTLAPDQVTKTMAAFLNENLNEKQKADIRKLLGTGMTNEPDGNLMIGDTAPVNDLTAATSSTGTEGGDNGITWTADEAGVAGNIFTRAIVIDSTTNRTQFTVVKTGSDIVVTSGDKRVLSVAGTLTDGTDPIAITEPLIYLFAQNGRPFYASEESVPLQEISWDDGMWTYYNSGSYWTSTADVASPELVPSGAYNEETNSDAWRPTGDATGTPTFTASAVLASHVIAAVNAQLLGITLTNTGASDGTQPVTAAAEQNFTGGANPTTAPPYLRVAGGYLYVQDAGEWKEVALQALS